jgi:hypothetical protein
MTKTPAGWYLDPDDPKIRRWWTGSRWVDVRFAPGHYGAEKYTFPFFDKVVGKGNSSKLDLAMYVFISGSNVFWSAVLTLASIVIGPIVVLLVPFPFNLVPLVVGTTFLAMGIAFTVISIGILRDQLRQRKELLSFPYEQKGPSAGAKLDG